MPDTYDAATRSEVMSRVKGRDTGPEVMLRRALFSLGVRGWRCHRQDVPGKPDLCFSRGRLAVFVDGAFWHGHPSKYWRGRTSGYWDQKIGRNIARDHETNQQLVSAGWNVVRIWDFEILADARGAAERVMNALERARSGEKIVQVHEIALANMPSDPRSSGAELHDAGSG